MAVGAPPADDSRSGLLQGVAPQRLLTFRERLADLASEYERLQARCEALAADNESLREALVSARGAASAATPGTLVTQCAEPNSKEDGAPPDEPWEAAAKAALATNSQAVVVAKPLAAGDAVTSDSAQALVANPVETDGPNNYDQMLMALDRSQPSGIVVPSTLALATLPTLGKDGARKAGDSGSSDSSSSSSSGSSAGRSRSHRKRKRRHHRRRSRGRHKKVHRKRRKDRDHKRSRSRDKKLANLGNYGSGSHEADVQEFISKNQLDPKVTASLRALKESDQKRIMGTDGGENSFDLIGRVKNPNGVVTSRINKLQASKR